MYPRRGKLTFSLMLVIFDTKTGVLFHVFKVSNFLVFNLLHIEQSLIKQSRQ